MPGQIVQTVYAGDDSGGSANTIAVTISGVAAGATLLAHVGWGSTAATCTVSDGAAYISSDGPRTGTADNQRGQAFRKENSAGGNFTVTATFSASVPYRHLRVIEISGLELANVLDQSAGQSQDDSNARPGTGANGITSGNTPPTTNAKDFLVGFSQNISEPAPGSGTLTAGTNYALGAGSSNIMAVEGRSVAATGAYAATFTQSVNNARITHILALKEAAAASARSLAGRRRRVSLARLLHH